MYFLDSRLQYKVLQYLNIFVIIQKNLTSKSLVILKEINGPCIFSSVPNNKA